MLKKLWMVLWLLLMIPVLPIIGVIKVKDINKSADKWGSNAASAATEFAANAEAAAADWVRNTGAAADTWRQAVTAAGTMGRFQKGVAKAGAEKYARKIRDVAAGRFSEGVNVAKADYKAGAEPYLATIAALTLSPRKPRGDPGNLQRVTQVASALHAKRIAMLGGGN